MLVAYRAPGGVPVDTLAADLLIGRADGAEWETFGQVSALEAGPDGTIYVLDFQTQSVRVFGPDGAYLRTIGRRGDGPAELRQASGMLLGQDGSLWIRDQGRGTLVVMDRDGVEVGRHALPTTGGGSALWDAVIDGDGLVWQSWSHSEPGTLAPGTIGVGESPRRQYVRWFDLRTQGSDSLLLGERVGRFVRVPQGTGFMSTAVPFDPQPAVAIDRAGQVWFALDDDYRITRTSPMGAARLVLQLDVEGPLATPQERAGWQRLMERAETSVEVPERTRVLRRIFTDDENRL